MARKKQLDLNKQVWEQFEAELEFRKKLLLFRKENDIPENGFPLPSLRASYTDAHPNFFEKAYTFSDRLITEAYMPFKKYLEKMICFQILEDQELEWLNTFALEGKSCRLIYPNLYVRQEKVEEFKGSMLLEIGPYATKADVLRYLNLPEIWIQLDFERSLQGYDFQDTRHRKKSKTKEHKLILDAHKEGILKADGLFTDAYGHGLDPKKLPTKYEFLRNHPPEYLKKIIRGMKKRINNSSK